MMKEEPGEGCPWDPLTLQFADADREAGFQSMQAQRASTERDVAWSAGRLTSVAIAYALILVSGGTGTLFRNIASAHLTIDILHALGLWHNPGRLQRRNFAIPTCLLCICAVAFALALRTLDPPEASPARFALRLAACAGMFGLAWLPHIRLPLRTQVALSSVAAALGVGWSSGALCRAWFTGDTFEPIAQRAFAALDAWVTTAALSWPISLGGGPPGGSPIAEGQGCWMLAAFLHLVFCAIVPMAVVYVLEFRERVDFLLASDGSLSARQRKKYGGMRIGQALLVVWCSAVLAVTAWWGLQVALDLGHLFQEQVIGQACVERAS